MEIINHTTFIGAIVLLLIGGIIGYFRLKKQGKEISLANLWYQSIWIVVIILMAISIPIVILAYIIYPLLQFFGLV